MRRKRKKSKKQLFKLTTTQFSSTNNKRTKTLTSHPLPHDLIRPYIPSVHPQVDNSDPAAVREIVDTIVDQIRHLKKSVEHTIELSKEKGLVRESAASDSMLPSLIWYCLMIIEWLYLLPTSLCHCITFCVFSCRWAKRGRSPRATGTSYQVEVTAVHQERADRHPSYCAQG